jgi:spermidine synthase
MLIGGDALHFHEPLSESDVYVSRVSRVLFDARTPFQQVTIVDTPSFGRRLYMDDALQSTEADEFIYHESLVHPAMLAHGAPRRVLILGGGEGATLREVLRWKTVEQATMVDIDGQAVDACKAHLPAHHAGAFEDPRTDLRIGDAFAFVRDDASCWDVIIADITDPADAGPALHCYTREFFDSLRQRLVTGGVFITQAGPCAPVMVRQYAQVVRTLRASFSDALPYHACVPSFVEAWGFVIASDRAVAPRLAPARTGELLRRNMRGDLRYLDAELAEALMRPPVYVRRAIDAGTAIFSSQQQPQHSKRVDP